MTAPLMFGRLHVLPVVADFLATFPEINIRLMLADRNVDLIGDHVDMAVRIGKLPDSSMVATQIGVMRTVTCASPTLLAGRGTPQTPDDLLRLPCVTVDTPMPSPIWRFPNPQSGAAIDVAIVPRLTVTTTEAAAQAAVRKVGAVRLLHYQAAEAVERGELQIFLEAYEPEPAPVHLVHVSRGQMPLKMRRFLDFAAPRLKQVLSELIPLRPGKQCLRKVVSSPSRTRANTITLMVHVADRNSTTPHRRAPSRRAAAPASARSLASTAPG